MPDFFQEMDTRTAVGVCQRVSDEVNYSLKLLGYQLANCQGCKITEDCDWSMRRERLQSGVCVQRVA